MNNKPVAWRKVVGNVTKHYQYNEMGEGTPLYTHPSEHDLGIAEAIGFEKGHKSAEDMLRHQQAEIEALKAGKIRAYDNGVEDGRKPDTNNKPVAWMETYKGEPNNLDWDKSNLNYGSEFHDVVPLYTHPEQDESFDRTASHMAGEYVSYKKQLTDEEIKFIAYPFESVYTTYDKQTDTDTVHTRFDQLGFAKAILRKAQEK